MSKDQQGSNTQFAKPPVLNPATEQQPGPNDTTQGTPANGPKGVETSAEPIKTNPSRQQVDPLQVLVKPVDEHKATLNQDFAQNRVDADGKRYDNAVGPTPDAKTD